MLVPILRAGLGMVDGILEWVPEARVCHIGIYRDKFIKSTVEYYLRLPQELKGKRVLLLDPLLATGETACAAIDCDTAHCEITVQWDDSRGKSETPTQIVTETRL